MKSIILKIDLNSGIMLPIAHTDILQGIVYRLMSGNPALSEQMHDEGFFFHNRSYKLFTYSRLHGSKQVFGKKVFYKGVVTFEIRSVSDEIINTIADTLKNSKVVNILDTTFELVGFVVSENGFLPGECKIKMLTPICIHQTEEKITHYFSPADLSFSSLLNDNFRRKYSAFYENHNIDNIFLTPILLGERDKCVTKFKDIYITAYYGKYMLKGNPEYIKFLYYAGLGSKNSQGFGMFELI